MTTPLQWFTRIHNIRLWCVARGRINRPTGSGRGGAQGDRRSGGKGYTGRRPYRVHIIYLYRSPRGHFIVVTAAPDFRGARPARRVFIGRRATHGRRHVRCRRAQNILYIHNTHGCVHAGRSVATSRCQGIRRRVIHTWNINRSIPRAPRSYDAPRASTLIAFSLVRVALAHRICSCAIYNHIPTYRLYYYNIIYRQVGTHVPRV